MLPLLGRSPKAPCNTATIIEDWYVPTEEELLRGRSETAMDDNSDDIYKDLNEAIAVDTNSFSNFNCEVVIDEKEEGEEITFTDTNEIEFIQIVENSSDESDIESLSSIISTTSSSSDYEALLNRITELEVKFEVMNAKLTKMESTDSDDSDPSAFVNNFIGLMHEMMKTGFTFQQKMIGKLCDEFDEMFEIDFKNFDPFKQ